VVWYGIVWGYRIKFKVTVTTTQFSQRAVLSTRYCVLRSGPLNCVRNSTALEEVTSSPIWAARYYVLHCTLLLCIACSVLRALYCMLCTACSVLLFTVLYYMLCTACSVLHALYYSVMYCSVMYCSVLYCTALYCTALYCTALYCTALYCTAL
jgi:hypothetical protein